MSVEPHAALFVGVGVGAYDDAYFAPLPHAARGVREIADLLRPHGCETRLAVDDPTEQAIREHLRRHLPSGSLRDTACLVVMWAGHGDLTPEPAVQLIARDTRRGETPWIKAGDLAGAAARSGARQILLVLDTCFSGDAGLPALGVLSRVLGELPAAAAPTWVGVLTSSLPFETARDGAFGSRLVELLRRGPQDPMLQRRWSPHDAHIRLEDVADALASEWDGIGQAPTFQRQGTGRWVFPNPLFDPTAPAVIVEHLLLAARGADPGEELSFFTGRVEPLDEIVTWLQTARSGVLVVTGPAGSGKSAIVGRIVSLSDPAERRRILDMGPLDHEDPGAASVDAHIHARGLTAEDLVEQLDRRLVAAEVLPPHDGGRRNRGELLGALERAGTAPVIAIDGLDETGSEAQRIAEDVIRLLRTHARFLVGTREVGEPSLVEVLAPDVTVDLGNPRFAEATRTDAVAYIAKRLASVESDTMDPEAVGHALVRSAAASGEGVFLLARIVTAQLREAPIDTTAAGWEAALVTAVDAALDRDLVDVPPLARGTQVVPDAARELLAALAWSYGAGMPDDVWAVAAGALSSSVTTYSRDDVLWLLEHAGRYVVESGEAGRAVYRLAHQRLVELFLPSRRLDRIAERGAELSARLSAYYRELLEAGASPAEPAYLWRYAWRHAADGGPAGIDAFRPLVAHAGRVLLPDLAMAVTELRSSYSKLGEDTAAVRPAEEAVELFGELAAQDATQLSNLAMALTNLGNHYVAVGRLGEGLEQTQTAVELYRTLAADDASAVASLAGTLNNLGHCLRRLRRADRARRAVEEALDLYRELAQDNPAYLPEVALTLNNLGILYSEAGESEKALAPAEEALDICRELAAANQAHLPDYATALVNVSIRYADNGRLDEAMRPAREGVELYRALAAESPGHVLNFGMALGNLANRYDDLKRPDDAIRTTREAVEVFRELAGANPGHRAILAMGLKNLGLFLANGEHHAEAIPPSAEALDYYREQAAAYPELIAEVVTPLRVLGHCCRALGRDDEALIAYEEAVDALVRSPTVEQHRLVTTFASTLVLLYGQHDRMGRPEAGAAAVDAAIAAVPDPRLRETLEPLRKSLPQPPG